jgi:hypothetical protein
MIQKQIIDCDDDIAMFCQNNLKKLHDVPTNSTMTAAGTTERTLSPPPKELDPTRDNKDFSTNNSLS